MTKPDAAHAYVRGSTAKFYEWLQSSSRVRSNRHVQANRACGKQPLADLEFVL
jgi:hypothetical protein